MTSIFDLADDRYIAWLVPDLFPKHPQPRLQNWSEDDLARFCGGDFAVQYFTIENEEAA